jgi:putative colanic acid biosysnthesis UDP-glucose lipid carrier transferase
MHGRRPPPSALINHVARQTIMHSQSTASQAFGLPFPGFSTSALIHAASVPLMAMSTLPGLCLAFGVDFSGAYLVAALLAFLLLFPGQVQNRGGKRLRLVADTLSNWLGVLGLLWLLAWASGSLALFDTRVVLAWAVLTPLLMLLAQLFLPRLLNGLLGQKRMAVVAGGGDLAHRLAASIDSSPYLGVYLAGCFDDRAPSRLNSSAAKCILGGLEDLPVYARRHRTDIIYITLPMISQPRIARLLDELRDTTASVYFVPDIFVYDLIQARMASIGGMPVLGICETPFHNFNGLLKRASDLILASLILLLIAPLLLLIGIAIKLDSPGPVLFRQRRYGLDGMEIVVYKFRSMRVCEDGATVRQATRNDSRVTRLGGFLRASSLDELPQFINVLQGRMSIVGPRPHAVAHNELYRKQIKGYMIRHKVRPGITGWAQVNGQRGETDTLEKMQARIDYDLAYLRNWSLRLDLLIILKTIGVVLRRQNAY